jgi:hypothetical protein
MARTEEKSGSSLRTTIFYIVFFMIVFVFYTVLHFFWSHSVPLSFQDLEKNGFVGAGLTKVWFIFAWGFVGTIILTMVRGRQEIGETRLVSLLKGWWVSLNAGFFEELIYRWLAFFIAMITLPILNFITFGLVKWFYGVALVPFADVMTLHALHSQLVQSGTWVFGAAIVMASVSFRNAHKGAGFIGFVNSWFFGMVMFYLMFNYGLLTAIVVHVLYDMVVITTASALAQPQTQYSYI